MGRLGLEGLLLFMYSNLFTSGSISTWRVVERFFVEFFGFFFDNTSWCYLVFHPSSLTLVLYIYCLLFIFVHKSSFGDCASFTLVLHLDKLGKKQSSRNFKIGVLTSSCVLAQIWAFKYWLFVLFSLTFQDFSSLTHTHKTLCILIHHFYLLHFYPFIYTYP